MSGSARNFRSGRDRTEERQPPSKIRKQNVYSGIERRSDSRVWSDFEENHSEYPAQEPLHGNRFVQKDDRRKLVRERSPGFDRWGGENKSHSPTESWDPPQRGKGMSQGRSRSRDRRTSRSRSRGRARSRSRSRGRARDRSQSPFEVHRRVAYGTIDRSGNRMMSSQPCKYFAAGMCRKGSQCTFFHPDKNLGSHDGSKYYEKNDLEQPRRRGSRLEYNRDEVEFSDNYERGGSRDYDLKRQQPIRKPFCKDFALGKCHRDNCRFSHDDPTADDRRVQNHDERTKSWNGPTWDDYNKTSDSVNASGGWGEKVHDPMVGEGRGDDRRGRNLDIKEAFATKSTGWGEGSVKNSRFHDHDDPIAVENRGDDRRRRRNPNEKSKVWNGPTWDDDAKETWDAAKTTGWGDNSVVKTKLQDPMAAEQRGDDRWDRNLDRKNESWYEVKDTSDAAKLTDDDKWGSNLDDKTKPANAPSTIDDVNGILDTVKAGGWGDGIGRISTFHDPMAADERGQHIIQGSSQFQSDEISARGNKQNLTLETGVLQTSIRGHENSHNIAVIEDSNALNAVKVSDPIDSGARLISSNGHNIDLNEVPFQNVNPETEAETLPKETGKQASEVLDIVTPHEVSQNVLNPKVDGTIDGKQEQKNVDGKIEESNNNNNTSKDDKAMRVFKIALVELVKEILKPKWKDGQMSREVHKTIVKKTVDKVSSTIPGDQVPNTQEKISQYLSISKAKITKLVQAYVERFSKT